MTTDEAGSLMWSLQRAMREGLPAQLTIGGSGTVSVYPRHQCYVSDVRDWDAVYAAPMEQIRVAPASWEVPPPGALPLEELQWRAAFAAMSAGASEAQLPRELVQLASWPNITRLPDELVAPVVRICALLWRKPTVGYLIPRVLELPPPQVAALLRVLRVLGHVQSPRTPDTGASAANDSVLQRQAAEAASQGQPASVVSRLWKRLLGQGA